MSGLPSIDWRRAALTTLRLSLRGTGWLVIHGGRLLQSGGEALSALGDAVRTPPTGPRRK